MHERRLEPIEMVAIHDRIEAALTASDAVEAAVFTVFRMLNPGFDAEFAAETPRIDGRDYRIPSEQWVQIGNWLQERCDTAIDKTQITLTWMNWGPSSIEKEAVR